MKSLKLNLNCIINCTSKTLLKFGLLIFFLKFLNFEKRVQLERGQLGSYWPELAILTLVTFIAFVTYFLAYFLACFACVALDGNPALGPKCPVTNRANTSRYCAHNSMQTDRCESDIKYDSITNRQLPRRTVLWDSTATSDYR